MGSGLGEGKMNKGGQLYGDRWKLDFWCGAYCSVYRCRNIIYAWNIQCYKAILSQLIKKDIYSSNASNVY